MNIEQIKKGQIYKTIRGSLFVYNGKYISWMNYEYALYDYCYRMNYANIIKISKTTENNPFVILSDCKYPTNEECSNFLIEFIENIRNGFYANYSGEYLVEILNSIIFNTSIDGRRICYSKNASLVELIEFIENNIQNFKFNNVIDDNIINIANKKLPYLFRESNESKWTKLELTEKELFDFEEKEYQCIPYNNNLDKYIGTFDNIEL